MRTDVRWAAGFFEGEGCVTWSGAKNKRPRLDLASTDFDVVRRFHRWARVGRIYGPYKNGSRIGKKPILWWSVSGQKAMDLADRMRPYMGRRRRDRIAEVSRLWRDKQKEMSRCKAA